VSDTPSGPVRRSPPTICVVHPRERRSKCSLEPLRDREGFVFWTFPERGEEPLEGYVRLGMGGPLIGPRDAAGGLLVLDGTWRLAAGMEADYSELPVRSLPELETAYPRSSKIFDDPAEGLASIEALWAAYRLMGRCGDGLLDHYRWAEQFLAANSDLIKPDPP
jgi:pre-rRNA-processing protein TSR3